MITINSYDVNTGEHKKTMEKSITDYTEWLRRAINREYKIGAIGDKALLFGGRGTRYFIVEEAQQHDNL